MSHATNLLCHAIATLTLAFVLSLGTVGRAQAPVPPEAQVPPEVQVPPEAPPTPAPPRPPSAPVQRRPRDAAPNVTADSRNVNLEVTVTQQLGGNPVSKTLAFVVADSSRGSVRSGLEVPVAQSTFATDKQELFPTVQYRPVGFHVDAAMRILDNDRIWLDLSLDFSSVLPADVSKAESVKGYSSFANAKSDLNLLLESGKPVTFTQSTDPSTGQEYSVQVKATIIK